MALTRRDILHIAELARLHIPEERFEILARQFNEIVGYFEKLRELQTDGIEPTTQVISGTTETGTPLRPDVPGPSFRKEEVVANAPDRQDQFFKVPRMIDDGEA